MKKMAAITAAALVLLTGCNLDTATKDKVKHGKSGKGSDKSNHSVVLQITTDGSQISNVTYSDSDMNISQANNVGSPWKKSFTVPDGEFLDMFTLSGQNGGSGKISCKVIIDGKVVKQNSSTGQYAVVTCG